MCIGEDPHRVEAIIAKLRAAAGGSGPGGMFTLALAAIDIALWDIRGKALGLPIWKLLGGYRSRVPAYASGALRRGLPLDTLVSAAAKLKGDGWTADEDAARRCPATPTRPRKSTACAGCARRSAPRSR